MAMSMAGIGILRFGILELETLPVAMIIGFDYNGTMYLYNSAYIPRYESLSIGLLSKILCIQESINDGMKKWDFLKGSEDYKYQLGGREIRLQNCRINIG
jgi:CelD/BcsL family acetyltransferase involved in cellulose biosynthesis